MNTADIEVKSTNGVDDRGNEGNTTSVTNDEEIIFSEVGALNNKEENGKACGDRLNEDNVECNENGHSHQLETETTQTEDEFGNKSEDEMNLNGVNDKVISSTEYVESEDVPTSDRYESKPTLQEDEATGETEKSATQDETNEDSTSKSETENKGEISDKHEETQQQSVSNGECKDEETKLGENESTQEEEKTDEWTYVLGHDRLKYKVLRAGPEEDSRPVHGQIVTVRCSGELEDGTKVDENEQLRFTVGDGDVIQALDLCIALMNVQDVSQIVSDAKYAYGKLGRKPDVQPNAPITFEIELLKVEDAPDVSKLPIAEKVKFGDEKRERGNFWYTRGDFPSAINSYTKALRLLDESNIASESAEALADFTQMRVKCFNNLAAAQLKVEAWDAGIKSCDSVLKLQPTNGKAHFRKGKCCAGKGELERAIACLREAIKYEAESKLIHQELSKLVKKHKVQTQSNKEMYQRMLGTDKKEVTKKVEGGSSWWMYGGAAAAALVGMGIVGLRYWHQQ